MYFVESDELSEDENMGVTDSKLPYILSKATSIERGRSGGQEKRGIL